MKVRYWKEMANQPDPESCILHREVQGEALTGETDGSAIEPRNQESRMPMLLREAEGNMEHGVIRQSCSDPARSQTLCTSGSPSHRNWEISAMPGAPALGGVGKAKSRNPAVYVAEKSDTSVVPGKPSNKGPSPAEMVEERDEAKGNTDTPPASRTQSRISCASMGLEGVREAARRNKGMQFTALCGTRTTVWWVSGRTGRLSSSWNNCGNGWPGSVYRSTLRRHG